MTEKRKSAGDEWVEARRKIVDPVRTERNSPVAESTYDHPGFGQIQASRVSGGAVLYGSDFIHQHFVTVTIRRSQLNRSLSLDWHFGREELVEVQLSEAQWATFVSSMNVGQGVPCTIAHVAGKPMPSLPYRNEREATTDDTQRIIGGLTARVDAAIEEMTTGIGAGLSEKKRAALLEGLKRLRRDVSDSLPFVAKSFSAHMETVVEKSKVEVNAYANAAVARAGLAALGGAPPLQLGPGEHRVPEEIVEPAE